MEYQRGHVFPAWAGSLLASPLRRLRLVPEAILGPYIRPGSRLADIGCGMGFFSLPMAKLAGPDGMVFCIDVQEEMLSGLRRRAVREGLTERIVARRCLPESLGTADLKGMIDFALAFNVAHELPDPSRFLEELSEMLKPNGSALISEPRDHVTDAAFAGLLSEAAAFGFMTETAPSIRGERCALLRKQGEAGPSD